MHKKISSAKWWPSCPGRDRLTTFRWGTNSICEMLTWVYFFDRNAGATRWHQSRYSTAIRIWCLLTHSFNEIIATILLDIFIAYLRHMLDKWWPCREPPPIRKHQWQFFLNTLQWRHIGRDNFWNHQPHECLLNRYFRRRSKKTSKLRVTGLCAVISRTNGQ